MTGNTLPCETDTSVGPIMIIKIGNGYVLSFIYTELITESIRVHLCLRV